MGIRLLGYLFIIIALLIVASVLYLNSHKTQIPLVFAPSQILDATWLKYTQTYLEPQTARTLDPQRGDITTSEGESYTMLRSVWMGDKTTFDASWAWTKNNLQHKSGDHLFSWLFGKTSGGTYRVLSTTSASDADTDIALALLMAYARWQDHQYLGDARVIMDDIWNREVITIQGTPYLVADNKELTGSSTVAAMDPSYFNPAAYHVFAEFDNAHAWDALATSSYAVLGESMTLPLDKTHSVGLPPDWLDINRTTGALSAPTTNSANTTNFGFDALRVPWRLALDWQWFHDPQDQHLLQQLSFLGSQWQHNQQLATTYSHDGGVVDPQETPAMYGGTIGYFLVATPSLASAVYQNKLQYLYDPGANAWKLTLSYYDDNWAWFGIGLYNHLLPDLTHGLPPAAYQQ